jgi:MFS family permease
VEGAYSDSDRRKLMICTLAGAIITPLMSTMLNLALVDIGDDFGRGSHDLGYINTLFLLGSVIAMVPAGRLSGIAGMRRIYVTGLAITAAAASLAALSPSFWFLVGCRFVIGFGSAMMNVTSIAMLTYVYPESRRGWALGMNVTAVYLGLTLGPTLGGVISDSVGWRGCFALIICLCAFSMTFVRGIRYEIRPTPDDSMDWKGSVLWGISIFVLMSGVVNITETWAAAAVPAGAVLLALTLLRFSRSPSPVLNMRLFRIKTFTRSGFAAFLNYGASYCVQFFLSLYLQSIGALTATQAGLLLLVQPAIQVALSAKMGAVSDRMEDKRLLPTAGMAIMSAGIAMFIFIGTEFDIWYVVAMMCLIGTGMGVFSSPNTSVIMSSAPPQYRGEASGVVAVMRQTGMMVSMGIAMACISMIMGSADGLEPERYGVFADTIHAAFTICLGMCLAGMALSWSRGEEGSEEASGHIRES